LGSIGQSIEDKLSSDFFEPSDNPCARLSLASSIICDGTISASLVYYFRRYRVGMSRTEPILQQLVMLSVNMGMLMGVVAIMTLILFEADRGVFLCLAPHFVSSKLYVNSLIATLNSRRHFRQMADRSIVFTLPTISAGSSRPAVRSP